VQVAFCDDSLPFLPSCPHKEEDEGGREGIAVTAIHD